jgi:zinc protease
MHAHALLPVTLALALSASSGAGRLPEIKYEKYRLSNGLEVILHEDHSTPIVAVDLWYHVGSRNERPGRTGFAHLFEHMMFQGSKHADDEYFKPIQEAGGFVNGTTNTDRTNYFEVVPSNFLERALYMEADRMGFLLDVLTAKKLDNQRDVVRNERRQRYENQPYGRVWETLSEAIYPPGHPYSWTTIGSMEDLSAASLDDVKSFFQRFYTPSNATLVVAGDFKPEEAKALVEKHFGALPPGPPVANYQVWVPELGGEKRLTLQDRVQLPRAYAAWHTPPLFSPDDAPLDVLADVLARGKSSRLYTSLVYEKQIAQDVSAVQISRQIAGLFLIYATARPGHTTAELERAIDAEIERLKQEGPTQAEVERALSQHEADFMHDLEQVGGFNGVADRLNFYNQFRGEPDSFQWDLERYRSVTAADVRRAARQYLGAGRCLLAVEPMPPLSASASEAATTVDRTRLPGGGPAPSLSLPRPARARLDNGLELIVVEHHELPVLSFNLVLKSGSAADPPDLPGVANLTAQMLDEGTARRGALDIARELDSIGATLDLWADADSSGAALSTLKRHAAAALDVFADVVTRPAFPETEFERVRKEIQTRVLQEKDQPEVVAARAVSRILYGAEHPYGHAAIGTERALESVSRADVERFYRGHWGPGNATLVLLGGWERGEVKAVEIPKKSDPAGQVIYLVNRPGSAQSVISIVQIGLSRNSADYFPALVLNTAFGGMFASRLNLNLREQKGYTYGARSAWDFRKGAGPFTAGAAVQTKFTREAVVEFLRELGEVRAARPLTDKELAFAKNFLARGFPQGFETPAQIAGRLREMVLYDLPEDFVNTWVERVQAVSLADVARVAKERLKPRSAAIIVVGDGEVVRKGLESLAAGRVVDLDLTGAPLPAAR